VIFANTLNHPRVVISPEISVIKIWPRFQPCQDFRGVIIEGIKEIPMPRMVKSGQKGIFS